MPEQRYPTLALMGIQNPDQVQSYSLASSDPRHDTLWIRYRRPQGSLLPTIRKYEFDRTPQAADPSTTFGGELQTYEISPILNKAMVELDSIVHGRDSKEGQVDDILRQIDDLEKVVAAELAALRADIKKLDA